MSKLTYVSMEYSLENCLKLVDHMKNYKLEDIVVIGIADNRIKYLQHTGLDRKETEATPDSEEMRFTAYEKGVDSVILVHNHPDCYIGACPSLPDIDFLNDQMRSFAFLDITVRDALIVSKNPILPYFSFRESNLLDDEYNLLTKKDRQRVRRLQKKIENEAGMQEFSKELSKCVPIMQQNLLLMEKISDKLAKIEMAL